MSIFVPLIMFGWIPMILLLFMLMPARRAVIIGFIFAWLFLPNAEYRIPGLPDYTKMSATCVGVFLGGLLFDPEKRLSLFRPSMIDIPMAVFCFCPVITSITNKPLPLWHGMATAVEHMITWGIPYYLGRVYFSDPRSIMELGKGIILGGIAYMPLCAIELRISPRLHKIVYGFKLIASHQLSRAGLGGISGYRPQVFMLNGLMCGMWMSASTLVCFWYMMCGTWKKVLWVKISFVFLALFVMLVLCKATGALGLCIVGMLTLTFIKFTKMKWPILVLLALTPLYIGLRSTNVWTGMNAVDLVVEHVNARRAQSLQFRFENETMLAEHAWNRPFFGWGGYSRAIPRDPESGEKATIADGFWIITLGQHGWVGVVSFYLILLIPGLFLWKYLPAQYWADPRYGPIVVLATLSGLYSVDCLLNAMINPVFMVAVGGITGCVSVIRMRALGHVPSRVPQMAPVAT